MANVDIEGKQLWLSEGSADIVYARDTTNGNVKTIRVKLNHAAGGSLVRPEIFTTNGKNVFVLVIRDYVNS